MSVNNKSIILLSGGLDSIVSIAAAKEEYNISLALTFDYGQRSKDQEIKSASAVAAHYRLNHRIIEIPFLKEITKTSLVNTEENLPDLGSSELDNLELTNDSAKKVWVPNRNGLFINIAASFADSFGFTHILFGANKEEAVTFPDNSQAFIDEINKSLAYSTLVKPKVIAPLIGYDKRGIIKLGLKNNAPFDLIRSCYTNEEKHCGSCESCLRLKRAIEEVGNLSLLEIFNKNLSGKK